MCPIHHFIGSPTFPLISQSPLVSVYNIVRTGHLNTACVCVFVCDFGSVSANAFSRKEGSIHYGHQYQNGGGPHRSLLLLLLVLRRSVCFAIRNCSPNAPHTADGSGREKPPFSRKRESNINHRLANRIGKKEGLYQTRTVRLSKDWGILNKVYKN